VEHEGDISVNCKPSGVQSSYWRTMAGGQDLVAVQAEPLDVNAAVAAVQDDGAGGIAMFIGTTRNHFGGT